MNKPPRIVGVPEGSRSRHIRAEPVAGLQREFHVLAVIAHRSAETLFCLAAPASRKAKGVAQASVVLVVGCQARRRAEHPGPQQFLWIRASLRRLVNVRSSDQFTGAINAVPRRSYFRKASQRTRLLLVKVLPIRYGLSTGLRKGCSGVVPAVAACRR